MVFVLQFLFCIFIDVSSLDLYVVPFNTRSCAIKISPFFTPCTGSATNPFDDLYSAFQSGVLTAQMALDMNLNFFLSGNNQTPGHWISSCSYNLFGRNGSPFENYQGKISIQSYPIGSFAYVHLKTDNFTFLIQNSLILNEIIFLGFDMHVSNYSCADNFTSCYPDQESLLLNDSASICYLDNRKIINNSGNVLNGFIQLVGKTKAALLIQDVSVKYFNSFEKQINFIWNSAPIADISINRMTIDQIYLPGYFLLSEVNCTASIVISNFQMTRYNEFFPIDLRVSRNWYTFLSLENIEGTLTINSVYIQRLFVFRILQFFNAYFTISISNFQVSYLNEKQLWALASFLRDVYITIIYCANSKTNFTVTSIDSVFSKSSLLITESDTIFRLYNGYLRDFRVWMKGSNNFISLKSILSSNSESEGFLFSFLAFNNSVELIDCIILFAHCKIYFYASDNLVLYFNNTIYGLQSQLAINFHRDTKHSNLLSLKSNNISFLVEDVSFMISISFINIQISDSIFSTFKTFAEGLIEIYGEQNIITISNCQFENSTNHSIGAIYESIGGYDNSLTIINCSFSLTESQQIYIILIDGDILTIINSQFSVLNSPMGGFIVSKSSLIILNNCSLKYTRVAIAEFILLFSSEITIMNSNFSTVLMNIGAFAQVFDSNLSLIESNFYDLFSNNSIFFFYMNCHLKVSNCRFSTVEAIDFLFAFANNIILISNTIFFSMKFDEGGLFQGKFSNQFYLDNLNISSVSSRTSGTIIDVFQKNLVIAYYLNGINVTSRSNAIFTIYQKSNLSISYSSFINCSSAGFGGLIYSNVALIQIEFCCFYGSFAKAGGSLYIIGSDLFVSNIDFRKSSANALASVIYAEESSINVQSSNFTSNMLKNSLIQFEYSVIYIENSGNDKIILENLFFQKDGINSYFIIFVNGGLLLKLNNISFIENSEGFSLMKLTDIIIEMKFVKFEKNSVDSLLLISESLNEFITLEGLNFENNNFCSYLISIKLKNSLIIKDIVFQSNVVLETNAIFLEIIGSELANLTNFNVFDNSEGFFIADDNSFLKVSDCLSLLLNCLNLRKNEFLAINAMNSSIQISKLLSFQNNHNNFIVTAFTNLSIYDSHFEDHNSFYLPIAVYTFVITLIKSKNSNIKLINSQFINNQNFSKMFPTGSILQYELLLLNGSFLEIKDSVFRNDLSFSFKIDSFDSITINGSLFEFNDKDYDYSQPLQLGGIYLTNTSRLHIENSIFSQIGSKISSSALYIENSVSQIKISIFNSKFLQNTASQGGSISLIGLAQTVLQSSIFKSNKAIFDNSKQHSGLGGAIYTQCINHECYLEISQSVFVNNLADILGGNIFLENDLVSSIKDTTFSHDIAFLDDSENSIVGSPHDLNFTSMVDENNNTRVFFSEDQNETLEINNAQSIKLSFSIFTRSNLKCYYESNSSIFFTESPNSPNHIKLMKGTITFANKGDFSFSNLIIYGQPNRTYELSIELKGRFTISRTLSIKIRLCKIGEYYDSILETCLQCPFGSYSLRNPVHILSEMGEFMQKNISICEPCIENSMCQGSKMVPVLNYWISDNPNSTIIMKCSLESCIPQNLSGFNNHITCALGYKGPLCVKCDKDFVKESFNSKCLECEKSLENYFIFIGKFVLLLLFISYLVYLKLFSSNSTKIEVILTIVRDHFNQIFILFAVSGFVKIDMSFYENITMIASGVILNMNCFIDEVEIIYFMVFNIMISPLYLMFFISVIFFLFFLIKLLRKKQVYFKYYLKTILTTFVVICDMQYSQILVAFFALFQCINIDSDDPHTYLKLSPNILCYSFEHSYYIKALAVPALLIWILGLPFTCFFILNYLRRTNQTELNNGLIENHDEKVQQPKIDCKIPEIQIENGNKMQVNETKDNIGIFECERKKEVLHLKKRDIKQNQQSKAFENDIKANLLLSFLFIHYEENKYYWSCIIMIWKFVLALLVSFVEIDYVFIALYVFYFIMILIYQVGKPYKAYYCSSLIIISFFCNLITVVLLEYVQNVPYKKTPIIYAYVIVQFGFLFVAVIYIFFSIDYREIIIKLIAFLKKKKRSNLLKK